ncbi:MAG: hypothetical protein Q9169_005981 [Polycauliona sp. 2 TL-2023]
MIQPKLPCSFRKRKGKSNNCFTGERKKRSPGIPVTVWPDPMELSADIAATVWSMAMDTTKGKPRLLRIAPELREQIYRELLYDLPSSLSHLLLVNRQISREVKPWMFRQPLTFHGQQSLYKWLASVDPVFLPNVVNIRFVLHDLQPDQIVHALGERLARASVSRTGSQPWGSPYDEAFERELCRVKSALSWFPNIRSFALLQNVSGDPQPPHRMLVAFATLLLKELPLVSFMMPQGVRQAMDQYLSPTLRHLQITDHKTQQAPGFSGFIESFPNLCSLEVCNGVQALVLGDTERSACQQPTDLLGNFSALKSLVVCMYQADDRPRGACSTFGNLEFDLQAIKRYRKSLEVFKLLCIRQVDRSSLSMQDFFYFVQSSSLKYIETGFWWTPLPREYPKSIRTIAIRFEDHYARFPAWNSEFSNAIDPVRSTFFADHPHLKEILLYLPSKAYGEREDHQEKQRMCKAQCWNHGVQLKVIYKNFRCEHRHRGPFLSYGETWPKDLSSSEVTGFSSRLSP